MRKATEDGKNLAQATNRVIQSFQRMDNHSAAVAKNLKSIRDPALRAKAAVATMRGTFTGTISTLDRLEDKLTLVKIKLDNMGAAGTLLRKGFTALKASAAAAAIGGIALLASAIRDMGEFSPAAKAANDKLTESLKRLNIEIVSALTGVDKYGAKVTEWARAVDNATAIVKTHATDIEFAISIYTSALPGLAALKLGYEALASSTASSNAELRKSIELTKQDIELRAQLTKTGEAQDKILKRLAAGRGRFGFIKQEEFAGQDDEFSGPGGAGRKRKGGGRGAPGLSDLGQTLAAIGGPDIAAIQAATVASLAEAKARQEVATAATIQANRLKNLTTFALAELALVPERVAALQAEAAQRKESARLMAEQEQLALTAETQLRSLAQNGIGLVTSSMGDMISALAEGGGAMSDFGAAFAGRFGGVVRQAGEAAVAAGTMALLIQAGAFETPGGAGLLIGAGLTAIVAGSVLEGMGKRASKGMSGGTTGGGAAAAAQDAVSAVAGSSSRRRSQDSDRPTLLRIGEHEFRGMLIATMNQGLDTGEVGLVPAGGAPL